MMLDKEKQEKNLADFLKNLERNELLCDRNGQSDCPSVD